MKKKCRNATMHNQNVLHGDTQSHRRPVHPEMDKQQDRHISMWRVFGQPTHKINEMFTWALKPNKMPKHCLIR